VRQASASRQILPFAALVLVWLAVGAGGHVSPVALPSPLSVARSFGRLLEQGEITAYTALTLERMGMAAVLSIAVGLPVGFLVGLSRTMAQYCYPILRFTQSLSGIAWLPLFLLWFGFGQTTILLTVAYTFLFPLIYNTVVGLQSIPWVLPQAVRTMGGSRWHVVAHVVLPGSLPHVLNGVRLGFTYGWREVIAAEMLMGNGGLGYLIFQAQSFNLTDEIVAGMIFIGLLWVVIDYFLLQPVEEATILRWRLVQR
jgi:taurine transport system permease protein